MGGNCISKHRDDELQPQRQRQPPQPIMNEKTHRDKFLKAGLNFRDRAGRARRLHESIEQGLYSDWTSSENIGVDRSTQSHPHDSRGDAGTKNFELILNSWSLKLLIGLGVLLRSMFSFKLFGLLPRRPYVSRHGNSTGDDTGVWRLGTVFHNQLFF